MTRWWGHGVKVDGAALQTVSHPAGSSSCESQAGQAVPAAWASELFGRQRCQASVQSQGVMVGGHPVSREGQVIAELSPKDPGEG